MKILKILSRVYVEDLDEHLNFYEKLMGMKVEMRTPLPDLGLELAQIDDLLIIAGLEQTLKPFKRTQSTFLVDSVEEYQVFLEETDQKLLEALKESPLEFT
ncbi:VOC family protein [Methanobacterium subterraneum]|uniref:VOC family protein n=1 Tax=Methanobacterium subterraneum TaxID=59277 RepID=UPI00194DBD48|nr:VOC family protein [Methanobacterium subterraneum]